MGEVFAREWALLRHGRGQALAPAMLLTFAGILAIVILTGVLQGIDAALTQQIKGAMVWLLLVASLSVGSDGLFAEDAQDGTLAQAYLNAGGSFWPYASGALVAQAVLTLLPTVLVFLALWGLAGAGAVPWLSLVGVWLPLVSLRLLAGALSLVAVRVPGLGALLYLILAAPLLLLAVGGLGVLALAVGFIFAPLFFALVPPSLRASQISTL